MDSAIRMSPSGAMYFPWLCSGKRISFLKFLNVAYTNLEAACGVSSCAQVAGFCTLIFSLETLFQVAHCTRLFSAGLCLCRTRDLQKEKHLCKGIYLIPPACSNRGTHHYQAPLRQNCQSKCLPHHCFFSSLLPVLL